MGQSQVVALFGGGCEASVGEVYRWVEALNAYKLAPLSVCILFCACSEGHKVSEFSFYCHAFATVPAMMKSYPLKSNIHFLL